MADVNKVAFLRESLISDIKVRIDSQFEALILLKEVSVLKNDRDSPFMLLDKSVGIQTSVGNGCATFGKMGTCWAFMGVGNNC